MDDVIDKIMQLDAQFQDKNKRILDFFYSKIENEKVSEVEELYRFSLGQYLKSMDSAFERINTLNNPMDKLRLFLDRDLYLNFLFDAYGIPKDEDTEKKK